MKRSIVFGQSFFRPILIWLAAFTLNFGAAQHVKATLITVTLVDVIFADGATATGSFQFDLNGPSNESIASFNIVTTDGVADNLHGATYSSDTGSGFVNGRSRFLFFDGESALALEVTHDIVTPNFYSLVPGEITKGGFNGSGEFTPDPRVITTGTLFAAPLDIPEPGTVVLTGVGLIALLAVLRVRRRTTSSHFAPSEGT